MKKLLVTAGTLAVMTMALFTAQASAKEFSDSSRFANWYAKAAVTMQHNNIITGYEDGSFRGEAAVSRAELAVMLDRLAKALGMELFSEPRMCTLEYRYGLTLYLIDQNGNAVTGAKITADQIGGESTTFDESGEGRYAGIGEGKGYYNITIEKAGYATHRETFKFDHDGCHVTPQMDTILFVKKA